jgi:hypothetical protein
VLLQQQQPQDFPLQVVVFILLEEAVVLVLVLAIREVEALEAAPQVCQTQGLATLQAESGTQAAGLGELEMGKQRALAVLA